MKINPNPILSYSIPTNIINVEVCVFVTHLHKNSLTDLDKIWYGVGLYLTIYVCLFILEKFAVPLG